MPGVRGMKRGGHAPHLQKILDALARRKAGMTVSQMARLVDRDRRSLQGSLSAMRMAGKIVASGKWSGTGRWREMFYVLGKGAERVAPAGPRHRVENVAGPADRKTTVDDAQVHAVECLIARWGRQSAGAA